MHIEKSFKVLPRRSRPVFKKRVIGLVSSAVVLYVWFLWIYPCHHSVDTFVSSSHVGCFHVWSQKQSAKNNARPPLLCSTSPNPMASANVGVNTRRLFFTSQAICPLDMLVNVLLLGQSLRSQLLSHELTLNPFPPNKNLGNVGNGMQVGTADGGDREGQ